MASATLPVDALAVLAQLQEQIDELRRAVTAQQETIDRLVAQHVAQQSQRQHRGERGGSAADRGAGDVPRGSGDR
jgi:hypothetical protein